MAHLTQSIRPRRASALDVPELSNVMASAFAEDPVLSWCYPDPSRRRRILPALFEATVEATLAGDEVYTTEDHLAGAICMPPGATTDEEQLAQTVEKVSGDYAPRVFQLLELMDAEHPTTPHFYVNFIGTRPEHQSRGIGSALLEHLLEPCDRNRVPAYLEATSEHNKRLYLRHGFRIGGEVRLPRGPSLWPMYRPA